MTHRPVLIVFLGGMEGSAVEDLLGEALAESALDLLEEGLSTGAFDGAVLVAGTDALAGRLPDGATLDLDDGPFHFGRRLSAVLGERGIQRPVYVGAGGVPLLRGSDLAALARHLEEAEGVLITNNYFSADLVAFTPGDALAKLDSLPAGDNLLPRLLHDQAGLETRLLPRSSATQFNIDSPADLAILKLAGGAGPRLSRFLQKIDLDLERYRRLSARLVDPSAELLLAGRVGSQVWPYLEKETACRLRVYSEERGMQAAGRAASGEARSLLAYHLAEIGCGRFFAELGELADAVCLDTRPMLGHLQVAASRAGRFWSDLACAERIEEPFLREFTQAANEASIPVVLGGHSLVAGGLMLLNEAAWREEDRRLLAFDQRTDGPR